MPLAFDPTGGLPANKIVNEVRTVNFSSVEDPYLLIPAAGPFYKDGFSLVSAAGITLEEGEHYVFTHYWPDATNSIGRQIHGSIALISPSINGLVYMNYQALGGDYPSVGADITTEGFHTVSTSDLFLMGWRNVPTDFPSLPHTHPLNSGIAGMNQIYNLFAQLIEAVQAPEGLIQLDDIQDLDVALINPVVSALNSIVTLMSGSGQDLGTINALSLKLATLIPYPETGPDLLLNYYEIPVAGFFKIKFGKMVYDPATPPTTLDFPVAFTSKVLFADVKVHLTDVLLTQDFSVQHAIPTVDGISALTVTSVTDTNPTAERTLTYWAIGL